MTSCIVLAAGRGSRLYPYTDLKPKCLTEIGGWPLIERQLATLKSFGIADIILVTGYLADQLVIPGTRRVHNPKWAETNMVESLFCAASEFSDDIIVTYSDIIYEPRVLEALLSSPKEISVVVDRNWRPYWEFRFINPLSDAESLELDKEGRIVEIGSRVDDITSIEAQYIGLMRFQKNGVKILRSAYKELGSQRRPWMDTRPVEKAYLTDLLMEMILVGHSVHSVCIEGGWLEIDTVKDYEDLTKLFETGGISRFYEPSALDVSQHD